MNNVFVYIELENGVPADVSLELLTKGRELATTLGVKLEAVVLGHNLGDIAQELAKYGADTVWTADDKEFAPFRTLPHTAVMCGLIEQEKPQIALFGATSIGRDFAPRVSSALFSGLTADCTQLVIGDHKDAKTGTEYENLLYQIRPAFGGNIIATIVNPDHRPQMATVREGVMRKEYAAKPGAGEVKPIDWKKFLKESDLVVKILDRQIEERKINIKGASVVVAGGYGVGSKENFKLIHELAEVLGGVGYKLTLLPDYEAYIKRLIIKLKKPIGRDIYNKFINTAATQAQLLRQSRLSTLVVGGISIGVAIIFQDVFGLMIYMFKLWPSAILPPLMCGLLWGKISPYAGAPAVIAGGLSFFLWSDKVLGEPFGIPANFIGIGMNCLVLFFVHQKMKGHKPEGPFLPDLN